MLAFITLPIASAEAETRKLKLYYLHTGEKAEITFKKNGKYIKGGLKKINRFLRDWRRNEPTKMNPRLMDLIWEVYKETGSRKHIHVISGYRSPATNNLLRKRGRGVAKKSQHTLGNALDFFIPGVNLTKLRNIGLRKGIGGVGYYPKSGSPFVHMDTGRVRHWPRMNRSQLVKVFPRGKTLHVPSDGKPLPGYNVAKANYERTIKGQGKIKIASAEEIKKKPGLLTKLFSREDDEAGISSAALAPKIVESSDVKPTTAPAATTPTIAIPTPVAPTTAEPTPTPETAVASLTPSQIPVPVIAPRIAIVKPPEPEVAETQVASLEPVTEPVPENALQQETVFAIPVPAQRPASPSPIENVVEPEIQVVALSANEISDLRQQVYAALESDVQTPINIPFKPATQVSADIPFKPATQIEEQNPFLPATKLEPSDVPSLIASASAAIENQITTSPEKPIATPKLVTALLPLEPNVKYTGGISVPIPSPIAAATLVATTANNIPVSRPVQVATTIKAPTLKKRVIKDTKPLSLENFQTANLDERLTGKWALATDASIKDIADIRPPAYGRNALRELPSTILSRGFSQSQIGSFTDGFTGSSIEFLDFKSFK